MLTNLTLIISSVLFNAIAQIFLKTGMTSLAPLNASVSTFKTAQYIIFNPFNILGFILVVTGVCTVNFSKSFPSAFCKVLVA